MSMPVVDVVHFSDVLCIWAYISQIRVEELESNFPDEVSIDYRFLQVFGDVPGKMGTQWEDRGGIAGYAAHVQEVAAKFEHIEISPQVWTANQPNSSLPAHLVLCGVRVSHQAVDVQRLLRALRRAFFVDLVDISDHQALFDIARQSGIDMDALDVTLENGTAHAQFAADLAMATETAVRSSPTMTFNEGRQILTGNVGYRVLEANVRELLRSPADQSSWC
jgi:predicted DsbA family dithiol-disulfide isomerase